MAWFAATTQGMILAQGGEFIPGKQSRRHSYLFLDISHSYAQIHNDIQLHVMVKALYTSLKCKRDKINPSSNHDDIISHVQDLLKDF